MKKLVIFIVLLSILSCEKKDLIPTRDFEGSWLWVQSTGGINGRTETPETTGEQRSLVFTLTDKLTYINGELVKTQSYSLQRGGSLYTTGVVNLIIISGEVKNSYVLEGGMLTLREECNDCFQHVYIKQ